jgi:anti-anti-sigma regulatory factor
MTGVELSRLPPGSPLWWSTCMAGGRAGLHGDINRFSSRELRSTLCLIGYVFDGVVVDFSDVGSWDESGVRAIQEVDDYLRAEDRRLVLRHPPPSISHEGRLPP